MANVVTDLALQSAWTHRRLRDQAMKIARLTSTSIEYNEQHFKGDCDTQKRIWVSAARGHSRQLVRALIAVRRSQLDLGFEVRS